MLSDRFTAKQGQVFGINNAAFSLGEILAPGLAIAALAVGSWRLAFVPALAILAVVLAFLHRWHHQSYVVE